MKLIHLKVTEDQGEIYANSIVESPAILTKAVKFKEEFKALFKFKVANEEQMIMIGPSMIPNVKIFRTKESLNLEEDSFIYFNEEDLDILFKKAMKNNTLNNITFNHEEDTKKVFLLEAWQIVDPQKDKSAFYGYDLPIHTIMTTYKFMDKETWNYAKDKGFEGFSIEGQDFLMEIVGTLNMSEEQQDERIVIPEEWVTPSIEYLRKVGVKKEDIEKEGFIEFIEEDEFDKGLNNLIKDALEFAISSDPNNSSSLDRGDWKILYSYEGPRDEKNREFCASVLDMNLLFRKEDIDQMSFRGENPMSKINYSIFKYKGSYNCRHNWKEHVYYKGTEVTPSALPASYKPNDSEATKVNDRVSR